MSLSHIKKYFWVTDTLQNFEVSLTWSLNLRPYRVNIAKENSRQNKTEVGQLGTDARYTPANL